MQEIAVLDAGGQYCHLIARRVRELGVRATVHDIAASPEELSCYAGIIVSGGPRSVLEPHSPRIDPKILTLGIPTLGICYGHQLLAQTIKPGSVRPGKLREYGSATLTLTTEDTIFSNLPKESQVWMSHGDTVTGLPDGFELLASTSDCRIAAMGDFKRRLFGVQFHPEVSHTDCGAQIIANFVNRVCKVQSNWFPDSATAIQTLITQTKAAVPAHKKVLFFISGGVDSAVAMKICVEALGAQRVKGIYVDTGFMRADETAQVRRELSGAGMTNVDYRNRADAFFAAVGDAKDPEDKRRRIGMAFLETEAAVLSEFPDEDWLLGQGTIYPDTIESGGSKESALIKTHHNRVPELAKRVEAGHVVEPLRQFYKDEVRRIGSALGLPTSLVQKEPFPGPGLGVRVLCSDPIEESPKKDDLIKVAESLGWRVDVLPVRSVGVQGDERSYAFAAVLLGRIDGAPWTWDEVARVSSSITNEIPNVNRVTLLLGSKPSLSELRVRYARLTRDRVALLQSADRTARAIVASDTNAAAVWQCPVVLLPLASKGLGSVVVRPVASSDGMTADFVRVAPSTLEAIWKELSQNTSIDAVFYDVTDKPPATIEWE